MSLIWKDVTLDMLRDHLIAARDELSRERLLVLAQEPLSRDFDRAEYGFAYLRAERMGIQSIHERLQEVEWLPGKIDTSAELSPEVRDGMSRWISEGPSGAPTAAIFGNDFIHALTRCALHHGFESPALSAMLDSISALFRDLAYLVCAIHCCSVFQEIGIKAVPLSRPDNLGQVAYELATLFNGLQEESPFRNIEANKNVKKGPDLKLVHDAEKEDL